MYERANNESRDMFIDKCVMELGCEVKDIKTKRKETPIEKMLLFKNRRVAHCTNRSKMLFSVGIRTISDGNQIRKLMNQKDVDKAFDELKSLCDELDKTKYTLPNKKGKKASPKPTPEELAKSLIKRMEGCTNSGGIHIPSEILGNEDWFIKLVEVQNWVVDIDNRSISKGD